MDDKEKVGKIVAGCGGALLLLTVLGFFGFAIVVATSHGRISGDEAMPGFISNCCCMFISLVITLGGVAVFMNGKKAKQQG